MEPWAVVLATGSAVFGLAGWCLSALIDVLIPLGADSLPRRRFGARLVGPCCLGLLGVAFMIGWACQEPDPSDEWVSRYVVLLGLFTGAVVVRATWRAVQGLRVSTRAELPIATVGLWRCRVVVSERFRSRTTPESFAAALAHEAAHARARDPLRIWLVRTLTDLQWPVPGARRRFRDWMVTLEMQRDDEAVRDGACPIALAESLLLAAHLLHARSRSAAAGILGDGQALALRVRRLLAGEAGRCAVRPRGPVPHAVLGYVAVVVLAVWLGRMYGDQLLVMVPGVTR